MGNVFVVPTKNEREKNPVSESSLPFLSVWQNTLPTLS